MTLFDVVNVYFVIILLYSFIIGIDLFGDIMEKKNEEQKNAINLSSCFKYELVRLLEENQKIELFCYKKQISFGMNYPQQINDKVENEQVFNDKHEISLKNFEKEIDDELNFKTRSKCIEAILPKIDTYRCLIMENVEKMIEYRNDHFDGNNGYKMIDDYQLLKLYNEYIDKCYYHLKDYKNIEAYFDIGYIFSDMISIYAYICEYFTIVYES